uniref:Short coiled-coil protein n=1 Tax=Equus asinus TaxID=9793 RepID=A0A9L0I6F5_EQUAS
LLHCHWLLLFPDPPTRISILIGRQCPSVRAKGGSRSFDRGRLGRRAAHAQACLLERGLAGDWAGLPSRRTLCGRTGRSYRLPLVQVFRPEASSRTLSLPAPRTADHSSRIFCPRPKSLLPKMMNADMDAVDAENQVELEEKTRLINQVLELQHTLEDLSARVDAVKEENLKLKSENQVLGQYIENLMSASSVFQTTDTKSKRK